MANARLKRHAGAGTNLKPLHDLFDKMRRGMRAEIGAKVSPHRKTRLVLRRAFVKGHNEQATTHVARCPKCSAWFASVSLRNEHMNDTHSYLSGRTQEAA